MVGDDLIAYHLARESDLIIKLPEEMDLPSATLMGVASVSMHDARLADVRVNDRVLVMGASKKDARELQARTENIRVVNFEAPEGVGGGRLIGTFVDVRIDQALPNSLRGTFLAAVGITQDAADASRNAVSGAVSSH